jgi:tetratricopeptide (TPR) repeat protein
MGRGDDTVEGRPSAALGRSQLMAWLDLPTDAPAADVAAARQDVVGFLLTAPPSLRKWARHEIEALDETPSTSDEPAEDVADEPAEDVADEPAEDVAEDVADEPAEDVADEPAEDVADEFDEDLADQLLAGGTGASTDGSGTVRTRRSWPRLLRSRQVLVAAAMALIAVIVVVVYQSGQPSVPGISGTPSATPSPSASAAALDQAKVAELMGKISASPRDTASLAALGDLYFQAGDYKTAIIWHQKVLDVAPDNVTALLALGACQFNLGDGAAAEKQWLRAVTLDPRQAEAHYDLGFLYLSQNPPNLAKVRQEWGKVVEIDPNSQIAKTVATHLGSLQTASPSAASSPSPGASPTPSASTAVK